MKTTLTDFQRQFRRAREAADRGESVIIRGAEVEYVFEKTVPKKNPFEGLKGVFGAVNFKPRHKSVREAVRSRLRAKRARR
ncbi:MAG: hypothetical protein ACREIA_16815 [Opitutaceae bacterium]